MPPGTINEMIKQAKTPAEQIHDLLASTPDLNTLALADKETVLALGSKEDADKLWALLKDKTTQVPGVVISADANTIKVAVTQDAKDTKTADFVVNLKKPLTDADLKVVIPGFEFKTQPDDELVGTYDSYTQTPATDTTAQAAVIVLREGEYIAEGRRRRRPCIMRQSIIRRPTKRVRNQQRVVGDYQAHHSRTPGIRAAFAGCPFLCAIARLATAARARLRQTRPRW